MYHLFLINISGLFPETGILVNKYKDCRYFHAHSLNILLVVTTFEEFFPLFHKFCEHIKKSGDFFGIMLVHHTAHMCGFFESTHGIAGKVDAVKVHIFRRISVNQGVCQ